MIEVQSVEIDGKMTENSFIEIHTKTHRNVQLMTHIRVSEKVICITLKSNLQP